MQFYWWFIAAAIFSIAEIITSGFVMLWFGVGAVLVGVFDLLGLHDLYLQVIIFILSSLILVFLSRKIFKNYFIKNSPGEHILQGVENLIGKEGTVTVEINNSLSTGRVLIESQDWSARSEDSNVIEINSKVKILRSEGAKLIVSKL